MNFDIHYFDEIPSTNDLAKELAKKNSPEGLVVVAKHQTAGHGQFERKWISPAGANLLFSLLLRPSLESSKAPMLTQIACRSIAGVLKDHYGIDSTLKHPNDILVQGKKICGILVESASKPGQNLEYAVIGVGLNVHATPEEFRESSISMSEATGKTYDLKILLQQILDRMAKDLQGIYATTA